MMTAVGQLQMFLRWSMGCVALLGTVWMVPGDAGAATFWPVQMPYEAPPKSEPVPDVSVAPNTKALTPEELQRAEALLPLLEGKQEFWAMGEFVHLGESVLPVVTKALTMPGPRIRYNAIETLSMMKSPAAVPALLETAKQSGELPRIREHALRVAVRLDPFQAPPAIEVMAKDANSTIRKSAVQAVWMLTSREMEFHDWDASSRQDRQAWAQEWVEWWNASKDTFELPEPRSRKRAG